MSNDSQRLGDYLAHILESIFKIDFEILWKTINNDLPDLYHRVKTAKW